jgi:hypothetical protein
MSASRIAKVRASCANAISAKERCGRGRRQQPVHHFLVREVAAHVLDPEQLASDRVDVIVRGLRELDHRVVLADQVHAHRSGALVTACVVDLDARNQLVEGTCRRGRGGQNEHPVITAGSPHQQVGAPWRALTP